MSVKLRTRESKKKKKEKSSSALDLSKVSEALANSGSSSNLLANQQDAFPFEKQVSKALARYLSHDPESGDDPNIICIDRIYELSLKWKPNIDRLLAMIQSVSEVIEVDQVPLSQQAFFLQSIANLEHLKAPNGERAGKTILEVVPRLRSKNSWMKSLACCILRNLAKQLDFSDSETQNKLSDLCDILKRSLLEASGTRRFEIYRITCTSSLSDIMITWCQKLPNQISVTDAPSGPSVSIGLMIQVFESNPISPFLRWTVAGCLQRLVKVSPLWYAISQQHRDAFLNLVLKSLVDYRMSKMDPVALTMLLKGSVESYVFLSALETHEYFCDLVSNILMILSPSLAKPNTFSNTQEVELRTTCLRFIGRFICEFIPPQGLTEETPGKMVEGFLEKYHSFCVGESQYEEEILVLVKDSYGLYVSEIGLGIEEAPRILYPTFVELS